MPDNRQYVCETMDCHRRADRYVTCERGRAFAYCLSCADGLIRILNEKDCGAVSYESLPLAEAVDALLAVYDRGGLTSISRFAPFMENLRHADNDRYDKLAMLAAKAIQLNSFAVSDVQKTDPTKAHIYRKAVARHLGELREIMGAEWVERECGWPEL